MDPSQDRDLMRYVRLVYARRYLFTAAALMIMAGAVVACYTVKPVYEAKTVVMIERNFVNRLIKDIAVTPSLDDRVTVLSLVMKSRTMLLKVIDALHWNPEGKSAAELEGLVKYLQDKTEITLDFNKGNRDMDSFAVAYRSNDPREAAAYVNTLVKVYIDSNLAEKREEAFDASKFVSEQLGLVNAKMHAVEREIESLKGMESVKEAADTSVQDRLLALRRKYHELLATYTEQHPDVVRVKGEIEELQARVRRENAGAQAAAVPKQMAADPKKLADLEREREAYKKIYEELIATLGRSEVSTQAEVQAKTGTFRVIDPAIAAAKPISPDRIRILLLGLAAGIGGGMGLVLLFDFLDDSVRSVDMLKGFGLPVLAVIPSIRNEAELARQRRGDLLLYSLAGSAVIGMLSLVMKELLQ